MDTPIDPQTAAQTALPSEATPGAPQRNRPPLGRRWQPGQSGNPAGRPRRTPALAAPAAVERALKGLVTVEIDGRVRRLRATEALAQTTLASALAGDTAARRDLWKVQAELEAARETARAARRQAREERARLAAEAAERAAEAADTEPTFAPSWDQEDVLDILERWNILVRRGGVFHLRQWVVDQAIFGGPAADEDDPWAWRALVDGVGERRSTNEVLALLAAVKAGEVSIEAAERWRPGRTSARRGRSARGRRGSRHLRRTPARGGCPAG